MYLPVSISITITHRYDQHQQIMALDSDLREDLDEVEGLLALGLAARLIMSAVIPRLKFVKDQCHRLAAEHVHDQRFGGDAVSRLVELALEVFPIGMP